MQVVWGCDLVKWTSLQRAENLETNLVNSLRGHDWESVVLKLIGVQGSHCSQSTELPFGGDKE
jgi:hypothetical protein